MNLLRAAVEAPYYALLRSAPGAAAPACALMAKVAWAGMPHWRRNLLRNARLALGPDASEDACVRCAHAMMRAMQRAVAEVFEAADATPESLRARVVEIHGREAYARVRALRRGAVLAGIHMGAFEPALAWLAHIERRVHVLYHPDASQQFEQARSRLRRRLGVVEHRLTDGVAAWGELRDALLADEVVVLHADRVMPGQQGAKMPFLGVDDARLPTGPVRLAASAGAALVPTFCIRTPRGLEVIADEPVVLAEEPLASREVAASAAQRALVASMERRIRAQPQEWLAFADLQEGDAR
ncbi:MAG: lysophospholipid acyltransferase family protein [Phycisphaerales bacterium]